MVKPARPTNPKPVNSKPAAKKAGMKRAGTPNKTAKNVIHIDGRDRRPWALASKERLLEAATEEIAAVGFERARLAEIAEGAISNAIDAHTLSTLLLAVPVGLSLVTMAGVDRPEDTNWIEVFNRFDRSMR